MFPSLWKSVLAMAMAFILSPTRADQYNGFDNPPPPGASNDFATDSIYHIGGTMAIRWHMNFTEVLIKLVQTESSVESTSSYIISSRMSQISQCISIPEFCRSDKFDSVCLVGIVFGSLAVVSYILPRCISTGRGECIFHFALCQYISSRPIFKQDFDNFGFSLCYFDWINRKRNSNSWIFYLVHTKSVAKFSVGTCLCSPVAQNLPTLVRLPSQLPLLHQHSLQAKDFLELQKSQLVSRLHLEV